MTEIKLEIKNMSAQSSEVPTNQQQQIVEKCEVEKEYHCERCKRKVELRKIPSQPGKQIITGTCQHCFTVKKWEEQIEKLEVDKKLITLKGTLTSPIQLKGESTKEPYYYAFIRLKGQSVDLPVIFKIKEDNKLLEPKLKKNDNVELQGNYSNSNKSVRKSFTAYSYQIINEKRIRKKCIGCCDTFTCFQSANYDYCRNCELNGSRYVSRQSKCPECGDGSGIIKFPNQPPQACKLCSLTKENILTK